MRLEMIIHAIGSLRSGGLPAPNDARADRQPRSRYGTPPLGFTLEK
jgi:hypothetical protein